MTAEAQRHRANRGWAGKRAHQLRPHFFWNGLRYAIDVNGYYRCTTGSRRTSYHRDLWELHNGKIPAGYDIHHINEVKTDNRLENLELKPHTKHVAEHRNASKRVRRLDTGETFLSLFAGIGGFDLGLERAGMKCIGQVECDPFCRKVLEKHWPNVPRWDDVRTFTKDTFNEKPDLICGGFPCQDISNAGKRAGIDGERSGLWSEFARIVREIRPGYVVVENVGALINRGITRVVGDLAASGYCVEWDCLPAASAGAPHIRDRAFVVANAEGVEVFQLSETSLASDPAGIGQPGPWEHESSFDTQANPYREASGIVNALLEGTLPYVCGRHDGVSATMDRVRALGNAVVPQVAEYIGRCILNAVEAA